MNKVERVSIMNDNDLAQFFSLHYLSQSTEKVVFELSLQPTLLSWRFKPIGLMGLLLENLTRQAGLEYLSNCRLTECEFAVDCPSFPASFIVVLNIDCIYQQHAVFDYQIWPGPQLNGEPLATAQGTLSQI